jgi:hypothetical protein
MTDTDDLVSRAEALLPELQRGLRGALAMNRVYTVEVSIDSIEAICTILGAFLAYNARKRDDRRQAGIGPA